MSSLDSLALEMTTTQESEAREGHSSLLLAYTYTAGDESITLLHYIIGLLVTMIFLLVATMTIMVRSPHLLASLKGTPTVVIPPSNRDNDKKYISYCKKR